MENIVVEMPYVLNQKLSFHRQNSPVRHGRLVGYFCEYFENKMVVLGVKLKTKSGDNEYIYFKDIIND